MQCRIEKESTIPPAHHNKTMVISLITSMVEMLLKEIISQIPDLFDPTKAAPIRPNSHDLHRVVSQTNPVRFARVD